MGHHLVNLILKTTDWNINILDSLSYASRGMDRLTYIGALETGRVKVFPVDLARPLYKDVRKDLGEIDYIVHMAAEVHVDKSIVDPEKFIFSNVMGTFQMLQLARECCPKQFLYFSTDEVFGPSVAGVLHPEWYRYNSSNPYSATKAAGEELTLAWSNTYKVPAAITHCTNIYGERQNPEAFIPSTISKVLRGEKVIVHTNQFGQSGKRFYINAQDVASAVKFIIDGGYTKDKFNITSQNEVSNLEIAHLVSAILGKTPDYDLVNNARPGCDFSYGLDGEKMRVLGWAPQLGFDEGLKKTVLWYKRNSAWLKKRSAAVFGGK